MEDISALSSLYIHFTAYEPQYWWFDIVDGLPDPLVKDGMIEVWDRPGMGVELNPDKTQKYLKEEDKDFFE